MGFFCCIFVFIQTDQNKINNSYLPLLYFLNMNRDLKKQKSEKKRTNEIDVEIYFFVLF